MNNSVSLVGSCSCGADTILKKDTQTAMAHLKFLPDTLLIVILSLFSQVCWAASTLDGRQWLKVTLSNTLPSNPQGGACYGGYFFQFANNGGKPTIYDLTQKESPQYGRALTCASKSHFGSTCFANQVVSSYQKNDKSYSCRLPFIYATGHYTLTSDEIQAQGGSYVTGKKGANYYIIVDVVDIENNVLVKRYVFDDEVDDCIAAWDFDNNRFWLIGYRTVNSYNDSYFFRPYTFDSSDPRGYRESGSEIVVPQQGLFGGILQDCQYHNGHIYIANGQGSSSDRTDYIKLLDYDIEHQQVASTVYNTDFYEAEGMAYYPEGDLFIITSVGMAAAWVLDSPKNHTHQYDNTGVCSCSYFAFQPGTLASDGYYEVSNYGQLSWAMGEIYNGRSDLKVRLTKDIDFLNKDYLFAFYTPRNNNAPAWDYSFRGTFDGNGHTISNFYVSTTKYNNIGLFPFIKEGAVIRNLTVKGSVNLDRTVSNVGLVGHAMGGMLINVKSELTFSNQWWGSNVNQLIGLNEGAEVLDVEPETHQHHYVNGFCEATIGTCDQLYQPATLGADGYYQLGNGGQLFWWAKQVNGGETSSKARLSADIDLEGDKHVWIPICDGSIAFTGIFDGANHSITNCKVNCSSILSGFFGLVGNTTTDPVIKDFSISGEVKATGNIDQMAAGVVAMMQSGLVSNVRSSMNITLTAATQDSHIGGIVGAVHAEEYLPVAAHPVKIDQCVYSGTINSYKGYGQTAGILGQANSYTSVHNCLMLGKIVNSYAGRRNVAFGGILGFVRDEAVFQGVHNCLYMGEGMDIITSNSTTYTGYIVARNDMNNTTSAHYTDNYILESATIPTGTNKGRFVPSHGSFSPLQLWTGQACASLNKNGGKWSQSVPFDRHPWPGVKSKITAQANAANSNLFDYYMEDYCLNDDGDATLLPEDAASVTVRNLEYVRSSKYMHGFISVCLPFALTSDLLPGTPYVFSGISDDDLAPVCHFSSIEHVEAGQPCFIKVADEETDNDWVISLSSDEGISLTLRPENPTVGICGSFNTILLGTGYYKLNAEGDGLNTTTDSSHCYPYRAYISLDNTSKNLFRVEFSDEELGLNEITDEASARVTYSIDGFAGQKDMKGLRIKDGKCVFYK